MFTHHVSGKQLDYNRDQPNHHARPEMPLPFIHMCRLIRIPLQSWSLIKNDTLVEPPNNIVTRFLSFTGCPLFSGYKCIQSL